jgi:hypothetical protein
MEIYDQAVMDFLAATEVGKYPAAEQRLAFVVLFTFF